MRYLLLLPLAALCAGLAATTNSASAGSPPPQFWPTLPPDDRR